MGCQAVLPSGRDLRVFFAPRSICIVGATDDASKWGYGIAVAALGSPHERPVYLVNRAREVVLGQAAYPAVTAVPGPVDLVVVCVPMTHFASVIDDALAAGARGILAITAGLGESDAGRATEAEVVARVRAAKSALIGPNCLGLVDNGAGVLLAAGSFPAGDVALLSQSGNLALEMQRWFADCGLGFSRFVSFGNQADVTLVDLIDSCTSDPNTRAIAVYAEDFGHGRAFVAAARRANDAGKKVVVLPAGGGDAARRSAKSHTGALTSGLDAVKATAAFTGAVIVHSPRELAQAVTVVRQPLRLYGNRIGVLTDGGGHGTLAASLLEGAGWHVPETAGATRAALAAELWAQSTVTNPVDLAGYGEQDVSSYARVVEVLLADPEIDGVLMTGYFGGYASATAFAAGLEEGEIVAAQRIAAAAQTSGKPVVVQSMSIPSQSIDALRAGGVPVLAAVEDAVSLLQHLRPAPLDDPPEPAQSWTSGEVLDYVGLKVLLTEHGIPTVASTRVRSREELLTASEGIAPPYVLKATGRLHKSDDGGVILGIAGVDALLVAYDGIQSHQPGVECVLEQMIDTTAGVELLVGVTRDPRFGPLLTVGAGGVNAEVLHDTASTLAPASSATVARLVASLRIAPLLNGFRGSRAVDLAAFCGVASTLSHLASGNEDWAEFECNPILVTPNAVTVLDARSVAR